VTPAAAGLDRGFAMILPISDRLGMILALVMIMSFLFRKRLKLFPGIWLNLSKGGVGTSVVRWVAPAVGLVLIVVAIVLLFSVE
jgi:hypothetical protein